MYYFVLVTCWTPSSPVSEMVEASKGGTGASIMAIEGLNFWMDLTYMKENRTGIARCSEATLRHYVKAWRYERTRSARVLYEEMQDIENYSNPANAVLRTQLDITALLRRGEFRPGVPVRGDGHRARAMSVLAAWDLKVGVPPEEVSVGTDRTENDNEMPRWERQAIVDTGLVPTSSGGSYQFNPNTVSVPTGLTAPFRLSARLQTFPGAHAGRLLKRLQFE
ncbi:hypothetical protein DFH09DRAFT_1067704 [Mycena vulgaris]|nr:hypothetical protein DFH09DRAFT_1067704 [Mycena vulgaris]